ncbi:hypothetical protein JCM8097_002262 [Rhodosporidiobolus ruineniae]
MLVHAVEQLKHAFEGVEERKELDEEGRKRVEGWEGVVEGIEEGWQTYLDSDPPPSDEDKSLLGPLAFPPLCDLLKLDPGVIKFQPVLLRRVFDLLTPLTHRSPSNKLHLAALSLLGPSSLGHIVAAAGDAEVTAEALELAARLGWAVGKKAGEGEGEREGREERERGARERWGERVFGEEFEERERGRLREMFGKMEVKTYQKDSPAIVDLLSSRGVDKYQTLSCRSLTLLRFPSSKRAFTHPEAASPTPSLSTGDYDGPVHLNRATFSADCIEDQDGEEETLMLEVRWEEVGELKLATGSNGSFLASLSLLSPPTLNSTPLHLTGDGPYTLEMEIKLDEVEVATAAERFRAMLRVRGVKVVDTEDGEEPAAASTTSKPSAKAAPLDSTSSARPTAAASIKPAAAPPSPTSTAHSKQPHLEAHHRGTKRGWVSLDSPVDSPKAQDGEQEKELSEHGEHDGDGGEGDESLAAIVTERRRGKGKKRARREDAVEEDGMGMDSDGGSHGESQPEPNPPRPSGSIFPSLKRVSPAPPLAVPSTLAILAAAPAAKTLAREQPGQGKVVTFAPAGPSRPADAGAEDGRMELEEEGEEGEGEKDVVEALEELSSVILTSFNRRLSASSSFLDSQQSTFTARVRNDCNTFAAQETLVNAGRHAPSLALSSAAPTKSFLARLDAVPKESRSAVARVKHELGAAERGR